MHCSDNWTTAIKLIVTCTLLVFGFYYWRCNVTQEPQRYKRQRDEEFTLDFVPRPPAPHADCDDLFTSMRSGNKFSMSSRFWSLYPTFLRKLGRIPPVGYSGTRNTQMMALHYLAARPSVVNICETGFSFGHSSFSFLTANSKAIVHSFDIKKYGKTKIMSDFLLHHFPGRFFIHFGDSMITLPKFIQENPTFRCDIIFVDGCHTYAATKSDFENFANISNRSNKDNAIIFDEYPPLLMKAIAMGHVWEHMRRHHRLVELMRCVYSNPKTIPPSTKTEQYIHGFIIGTFVP